MKIRVKPDRLLAFPDGREFKALKLWLLEYGNPADDYRDSTAGCYIIRSAAIHELEAAGFKVEKLNRKQYNKLVIEALTSGYYAEEDSD